MRASRDDTVRADLSPLEVEREATGDGGDAAVLRFEWFAIDYNGEFRVGVPARYRFRLLSDDGSKLFIDSKLVIDNDGTHGARMREGSISLTPGKHTIEVQYFQGPRYEVALILDVKAEAE